MIVLSSDPSAELVEIEYFIAKKLARTNVTLGAMEQALPRPQGRDRGGRERLLHFGRQRRLGWRAPCFHVCCHDIDGGFYETI
ncbi:MAG: hypothetical protein ACREXU_12160 [Gammaproteobacteria bacterium]